MLAMFAAIAPSQPRIVNAKLEQRPAGTSLEAAVAAVGAGPAWVGYAVRTPVRDRQMCCHYSWGDGPGYRGCMLEPGQPSQRARADGPVHLEPPPEFHVLLRVEAGRPAKVRLFSADCELDAGGLPVSWLVDIPAPESIKLLAAINTETAVTAISLHSDAAADAYIEQYLGTSAPHDRRRRVAEVVAARGPQGIARAKRVIREDPDNKVRQSAFHGLTRYGGADALRYVEGILFGRP